MIKLTSKFSWFMPVIVVLVDVNSVSCCASDKILRVGSIPAAREYISINLIYIKFIKSVVNIDLNFLYVTKHYSISFNNK